MFGDTPPAIVALDAASIRSPGFLAVVQEHLSRHPTWLVTEDSDALRRRLRDGGLGREGPGLKVVEGDAGDAVALARELGSDVVRLWGEVTDGDALPMAVRVAAHDAGIRLRLEAPFAQAA